MVGQKRCDLRFMRQVSSQDELAVALAALEPEIEVIADFSISDTLFIQQDRYDVTIRSGEGDPYTLKRGDNNQNWLFELAGNWLTLQNIILDGAKQTYTGPPHVNADLY